MTTAPTPRPEALKLADRLDDFALSLPAYGFDDRPLKEAAAELRRLHAENERLQGSLEAQRLISDRAIAIAKELEARKPLTDVQCDSLIAALCPDFSDARFPGDRPIMRQPDHHNNPAPPPSGAFPFWSDYETRPAR